MKAVADKASEIQGAIATPAARRQASLTDDEVTAIARTSQELKDWISGRTIFRTAMS